MSLYCRFCYLWGVLSSLFLAVIGLSEIFLSLIVKFLDPDKPPWQRALALELLHKLVVQPRLLTEFCRYYDCQQRATNILTRLAKYSRALYRELEQETGVPTPRAELLAVACHDHDCALLPPAAHDRLRSGLRRSTPCSSRFGVRHSRTYSSGPCQPGAHQPRPSQEHRSNW